MVIARYCIFVLIIVTQCMTKTKSGRVHFSANQKLEILKSESTIENLKDSDQTRLSEK